MSQTHTKPDRGSTYSTPHWVKVFGIIAIVLVLAFLTVHLAGGGGPWGNHIQIIEHWLQQP